MYAVTHSLPLSHSYPFEMSRYTSIALHMLDAPTMLKSMGDDVYEHGVVSKSRGGEIVCRPYLIYTLEQSSENNCPSNTGLISVE